MITVATVTFPGNVSPLLDRWPDYLHALGVTLKFEGGKVDDPDDRGGRTAYGVTQRAFTAWLKSLNRSTRDVWTITRPEIEAIYYREYWLRVGAPFRPYPLSLLLFDAAVNHGVSRALKFLASSGADPVKFLDARVAFYHAIVRNRPTQKKFLRGWLNRADRLRQIALPDISSLEELHRRAAA